MSREHARSNEWAAKTGRLLEQPVPGIARTSDGEFSGYFISVDIYSPLFEEAFALADLLENIEVVGYQILQLRLTLFKGIGERAGAQLKTHANPLASFLFKAESECHVS